MAKTIEFSYDGKEYTLEYTRRSIQEMEREGFNPENLDSAPMTTFPLLFAGAFKAHHRLAKKETIDAIYASLPDKEKLINALAEMYNEPLEALMAEPDAKGKIDWKTSW